MVCPSPEHLAVITHLMEGKMIRSHNGQFPSQAATKCPPSHLEAQQSRCLMEEKMLCLESK